MHQNYNEEKEADMDDVEKYSGFRIGRSNIDNSFILPQIIDKRVKWNPGTHLGFADLEKEYYSKDYQNYLKFAFFSKTEKIMLLILIIS